MKKGFTLIELLIVICIIATLGAIAVGQLHPIFNTPPAIEQEAEKQPDFQGRY